MINFFHQSIEITVEQIVGQHLQVSVTTGTIRTTHPAASKAKIRFQVLEECLDAPPVTITPNDVN